MNPDHELENFCAAIKNLRRTHNLTQTQMAQPLHISTATLRKLENGSISPRLNCDVLVRLSKHFGVQIYELFR